MAQGSLTSSLHPLLLIRPLPVAALALALILFSLWRLSLAETGLVVTHTEVGSTPVTIHRVADRGAAHRPVVVIAHGFAGSRQLMRPFALTMARSGYVAVSFDFLGHGRNPVPLSGLSDATPALLAQLKDVIAFTKTMPGIGGGFALIGHSMASDIVVRAAIDDPDVRATVAVSMYSPAVTADEPQNLLAIVGEYEPGLKAEAVRTVGLVAGAEAKPNVTYGTMAHGTARRAAISPGVEHLGVLFSASSLAEARDWINAAFQRDTAGGLELRALWFALLFPAVIVLAWPLSYLLPVLSPAPQGAGLRGRRLAAVLVTPAVLTPLLLAPLDFNILGAGFASYLATHFAVYGLILALGVLVADGARPKADRVWRILIVAAGIVLYTVGAFGGAIDFAFTSYVPVGERWVTLGLLLLGAVPFMLADEWITRGAAVPTGTYVLGKILVLLSLGGAVWVDLEGRLFLLFTLPIILMFFVVYGLFSRWSNRRTHHPLPGALANGVALAYALAVIFPAFAAT